MKSDLNEMNSSDKLNSNETMVNHSQIISLSLISNKIWKFPKDLFGIFSQKIIKDFPQDGLEEKKNLDGNLSLAQVDKSDTVPDRIWWDPTIRREFGLRNHLRIRR